MKPRDDANHKVIKRIIIVSVVEVLKSIPYEFKIPIELISLVNIPPGSKEMTPINTAEK